MAALLGLAAEVPLLACPLLIWRGASWAPSWWAEAALYAAATVTAAGVVLALLRPVTVRRVRWASVLLGVATGLTAVIAGSVFFGGPEGLSSSVLLLGAVTTLALLRGQVNRVEPTRP
ncbi:hypothetical protein ACIRVF_28705 [Kitasatospora sp. NPDC101157]|uniref:hypothetical protein n=1 Tax=Kitasatospora sp. NPDC101157 TaxID=3364098 RepID=UPI0038207BEA